jgi:hypothetical protein
MQESLQDNFSRPVRAIKKRRNGAGTGMVPLTSYPNYHGIELGILRGTPFAEIIDAYSTAAYPLLASQLIRLAQRLAPLRIMAMQQLQSNRVAVTFELIQEEIRYGLTKSRESAAAAEHQAYLDHAINFYKAGSQAETTQMKLSLEAGLAQERLRFEKGVAAAGGGLASGGAGAGANPGHPLVNINLQASVAQPRRPRRERPEQVVEVDPPSEEKPTPPAAPANPTGSGQSQQHSQSVPAQPAAATAPPLPFAEEDSEETASLEESW